MRAFRLEEKGVEDIYESIYERARAYLDTRQNDVHVSLSYEFARRLAEYYPEADRDVVFPAILLHDVGWKMVSEERQSNAFGPNATDMEARRAHEVEGAGIAGRILQSLDYDKEKTAEIMAIIDGHDTRQKAFSINDALVKDADKLWRCTPTGVDIDHVRFGVDRKGHLDMLSEVIDGWFFTPEARRMAREALDEARRAT
jgi:HD superfamily phosphodiesterase